MKNNTLYLAILISIMGLQTPKAMSQPEIHYPNPAYWYWTSPCDSIIQFGWSNYYFRQPGLDNQICYVKPYDATEQSRTIYGVALSLYSFYVGGWWEDRLKPMDRRISLDITLYSFTPGDSVVHPITTQTFIVEKGQSPDIALSLPAADLYPIYEFYFDRPVRVDGPIFVGAITNDSCSLMRTPLRYLFLLGHDDGSCCIWGYEAQVNIKRNVLIGYEVGWGCPGSNVSVSNRGWGVAAPSQDTIHTGMAQAIYPIIKPQGYLSALALQEGGDVRLKPNPARTRVTVEAEQIIRYIELTDMTGRTMMSQKYDGGTLSATLDISSLPQGVYIARVRTDKAVATRKLLVK